MDVSTINMPLSAEPAGAPRARGDHPSQKAASQPSSSAQTSSPVSKQALDEALAALAVHYDLKFEVSRDERTGSEVVRIYSSDGKQLLRQTPPEAVLKIAENLAQGGRGGLLGSLV